MSLIAYLQSGAAGLWPTSVQGWVFLIAALVSYAWGIWKLIVLQITKEANALGSRMTRERQEVDRSVSGVHDSCIAQTARQDALEKSQQADGFKLVALQERVGRMEGQVVGMDSDIDAAREQRHQDQVKLTETLTTLKSSVDLAPALDRIGKALEQLQRRESRP